ncbi:MAG: hypothetical protein LBN24_10500 [Mediterranea sp.]|jgi:hypothetical protein|nr:hypothetical protein [Mediterranea sp.]
MMKAEKLSFQFHTTDQAFSQQLYVDWDYFCRTCVTRVLESYLTTFDHEDTYIEIEQLTLNLGNIAEEEFYETFPHRLRQELERSFRHALSSDAVRSRSILYGEELPQRLALCLSSPLLDRGEKAHLLALAMKRDPQRVRHFLRDTRDEEAQLTLSYLQENAVKATPPLPAGQETLPTLLQASQPQEESEPILHIDVPNAGLCLITPWLPRLFTLLGLMDEAKRDFIDDPARIRAIFLMQQLLGEDARTWDKQELALNRLLVGLPPQLALPFLPPIVTEQEASTIASMLEGVKGNWKEMRNTSIGSFQHTFLQRSGHLEQQKGHWTLTVDPRPYDLLLDYLPWSYQLIRFPWLKQWIHVAWWEKQEFDIEV